MISLNQVSLQYPNISKPALKEISLTIATGECILLTGRSGCGKSSLLRLLSGIVPHVYDGDIQGDISVDGLVPAQAQAYTIGKKVGMIYQNPRMQFFCTTARDEMAFARENAGDNPTNILEDICLFSNELTITPLWHKNLFNLSSGERQRVAIAAVLTDRVGIILFDEPTSNLDKKGIEQLGHLIRQLKDNNITLIIAEHRLKFLKGVVDRVVRLEDGQIAEDIKAQSFWDYTDTQLQAYGLRHNEDYSLPSAPPQNVSESNYDANNANGSNGLTCQIDDDTTFHFPRSKITTLLGGNGSGKTTLLRTLAGLDKSSYRISLDGQFIKAKARQKVSFLVLQDLHQQLFTASVTEEIKLSRRKVDNEDNQRLNHYIDSFGLDKLRDKHPQALSGGEQQRVVIATALFADREVCLFDEPTSGLDGANAKRLNTQLRKLADAGRIVIIATHDPAIAAEADFAHTLHHKSK